MSSGLHCLALENGFGVITQKRGDWVTHVEGISRNIEPLHGFCCALSSFYNLM